MTKNATVCRSKQETPEKETGKRKDDFNEIYKDYKKQSNRTI